MNYQCFVEEQPDTSSIGPLIALTILGVSVHYKIIAAYLNPLDAWTPGKKKMKTRAFDFEIGVEYPFSPEIQV